MRRIEQSFNCFKRNKYVCTYHIRVYMSFPDLCICIVCSVWVWRWTCILYPYGWLTLCGFTCDCQGWHYASSANDDITCDSSWCSEWHDSKVLDPAGIPSAGRRLVCWRRSKGIWTLVGLSVLFAYAMHNIQDFQEIKNFRLKRRVAQFKLRIVTFEIHSQKLSAARTDKK